MGSAVFDFGHPSLSLAARARLLEVKVEGPARQDREWEDTALSYTWRICLALLSLALLLWEGDF